MVLIALYDLETLSHTRKIEGLSSEKCSCKTIKSMWVEVCESPDDLTTEAIDYFMNIFATKPNGSELLTTFSIDGISRILNIFGPNADRCKSLEATRKMFDLFLSKERHRT
ncbi:uncharacterized protein LOC143462472 [Clavelina lepadiformis]|uniref:uncharacterized protein LOC143462472 n=1 Tax=Clavelina lepadiformis TaxID=159417 RepID=UPI0040428C79